MLEAAAGRQWLYNTTGAAVMPVAAARRPAAGRAASKADPAGNPHEIRVVLRLSDQLARSTKLPPSSREIARRKAKAENEAKNTAAAQALARQVRPALRPPAGRLFAVDAAALLLRGPLGGIGSTERMVRTLAPLAAGGRHVAAVMVAAGGWQDEQALREALAGLGPKLAAIGLRICRRRAGLRMAKATPATPAIERSAAPLQP